MGKIGRFAVYVYTSTKLKSFCNLLFFRCQVAERYKDNDDAASSSGYSEVDFEEDTKKDGRAKTKR